MLIYGLLSLSTAMVTVRATCSQADIGKATMCTASLNNGAPAGGFLNFMDGEGDANWMVVACGNGDLLTAINCIERVMDQCKNDNSDAAHFFRKMIDIESYRRVVNFFCTNVRVYTANAGCIVGQHRNLDVCAHEAKRNFETQASATSNMDVLMRFQCIFHHVVVGCAEKVLATNCSGAAADIVKTVLVGLQAPICATVTSGVETGRPGTYDVHTADGSSNMSCRLSSADSVIYMFLLIAGSFVSVFGSLMSVL